VNVGRVPRPLFFEDISTPYKHIPMTGRRTVADRGPAAQAMCRLSYRPQRKVVGAISN
jgi:hypothetical protein